MAKHEKPAKYAKHIAAHDPIIDPCWDPVFKSIFTRNTTQSEIARKKLLSAILEEPVKEISISANEPPVSRLDQRQIRYDIQCLFNSGERADIEMTLYPHKWEVFRMEYYLSRLFANQEIRETSSGSYKTLKRSYQISLLARGRLFEDSRFDHRFIYYDPESKIPFGGLTAIITLELEKLGVTAEKAVSAMSEKERWAVFFKYYNDTEKQPLIQEITREEEGIAMAADVISGFTAAEVAFFHEMSVEKYELDMRAHAQEAEEIGEARGEARGWKKGRVEGRAEGRTEVLDLLKSGKSPEEILGSYGKQQ
ncbi:transposase [Spirochaetia bacterium]|nr:transposase [Spirochaetia bacterium]